MTYYKLLCVKTNGFVKDGNTDKPFKDMVYSTLEDAQRSARDWAGYVNGFVNKRKLDNYKVVEVSE